MWPTVLALSVLPGVISQAVLLLPQPAKDDERDSTGEGTEPGIDDMLAELPEGVADLAAAMLAVIDDRTLFNKVVSIAR